MASDCLRLPAARENVVDAAFVDEDDEDECRPSQMRLSSKDSSSDSSSLESLSYTNSHTASSASAFVKGLAATTVDDGDWSVSREHFTALGMLAEREHEIHIGVSINGLVALDMPS